MPGDAASSLSIRLLGPFEARLPAGSLLRLRSRKEQWLLALLILQHDRPQERTWLAGMLWPDSTETQALANLRNCLAGLRHALGPEADRLRSPTARALVLDLMGAEVDVPAFDAAIAHGDEPSLRRAVMLYRGPLLEGCMEAWAIPERQLREQAFLQALEQLAAHAVGRAAPSEAEGHLRRAIGVDPLRESAQRALMQVLAEGGNEAAALGVYRELRLLLHRELNAAPDPETTALFQSLRARSAHGTRGSPGRTPPAHNLSTQLTRFIGRQREMAEIRHLLSTARLLTLTGAGGCGKTRLALQVAAGLIEAYPDGVWLVELAPLADPALVPQAVASTLGVREEPGRPLTATLTDFLHARSLLVVLDNCEHLLSACAHLAESLVLTCADLRVLATSRERLGIGGEQLFRVPSLSLPDAALRSSLEDLCASEAIELFVDRARLTEPRFTLTVANAAAVTQVCHRLDGIPLAIELAAARLGALSVEALAERLNDRFPVLVAESRTALPRHQTLQALIDWSYDLLSEAERTLLRRLSVFAGGWTLAAAEAVCADPIDSRQSPVVSEDEGLPSLPTDYCLLPTDDVLGLLTRLVEKSLAVYEVREEADRYGLLETIRQYARDRLLASGETAVVRGRHLDWVVALAEQAGSELFGREQAAWLHRLGREHDNLRAALDWSLESSHVEAGLGICEEVWRFWQECGYVEEGRGRLVALLSRPEASERTRERAKALKAAGRLTLHGDFVAARSQYEEMLAIGRELGDPQIIASALNSLGHVVRLQGNGVQAQAHLEQGLALARTVGDRWEVASSLYGLGILASLQGENRAAWSLCAEALAMRRELGDKGSMVTTLGTLGELATDLGDLGSARALLEERLALSRELGNKAETVRTFQLLASVIQAEGDFGKARALLEEALTLVREVGDRQLLSNRCTGLAYLLLEWGEIAAARTYFDESLLLRRAIGHTAEVAWGLVEAGHASWCQGDYSFTQSHAVEALRLFEAEERDGILAALESLAAVALAQGRKERAARLSGAVEALREAWRLPGPHWWRRPRERIGAVMRAGSGDEAFAESWAAGRAMSIEQAIACALTEEP
jgi:predicted ATPase/DNA-binding SARP family transcriptional activator